MRELAPPDNLLPPARCRAALAMVLALLSVAALTRADRLVLANGDVVSGRLLSLDTDTCRFEAALLGPVQVSRDDIQALETDQPVPVWFQDAPAAQLARFHLAGDQALVLCDGPPQPLQWDTIRRIGDVSDSPHATGEPVDGLPVTTEPVWHGAFDVGYRGRRGNAERAALQQNLKLTAVQDEWRLAGYLNGRYAEQQVRNRTARTENEVKGGARVSHDIEDGLTAFVATDLERDEFEQLELRSLISSGVGLCWLAEMPWQYETRLSAGVQHESYATGFERRTPVGQLTSELKYRVNAHILVTQQTNWIPDFHRGDAYRLSAQSAAVFYLDPEHRLFIKSGIDHEYNSRPSNDEVERLDTIYFSNFGLEF